MHERSPDDLKEKADVGRTAGAPDSPAMPVAAALLPRASLDRGRGDDLDRAPTRRGIRGWSTVPVLRWLALRLANSFESAPRTGKALYMNRTFSPNRWERDPPRAMRDGERSLRDSMREWNRNGRLYLLAGIVSAALVWFSSFVISLVFATSAMLFAYRLHRGGRTRAGAVVGGVGGFGLLAWVPLLLAS